MLTLKGENKNKSFRRYLRKNQTFAEQKIWSLVKGRRFHNLKFKRQHGIGPFIIDFFCAEKKLVIEVDGDIHAIELEKIKDLQREKYLQSLGLIILRYNNNDILNNLEGVLLDLEKVIQQVSTSP